MDLPDAALPPDLPALDPTTASGQIYQYLIEVSGATADDVASELGLTVDVVDHHLAELEMAELVMQVSTSSTVTWEALQPATALRAELTAQEAALSRARERVQALSDRYWEARNRRAEAPVVETITDPAQIDGHFKRLQRDATREIRALDRPPYLSDRLPGSMEAQVQMQDQRMAAGLHYRVVYQRTVFDRPVLGANTRANIANGEEARELRHLPVKLTIMDDTRALVSLEPWGLETDPSALLVHPSALLDALIEIFEAFWHAASPVGATRGNLTTRQFDVLQLLAEGATDDAIARRLQLSTRTVTRTISEINDQLGATTRFQAGLKAAGLGYLRDLDSAG